jgi:hypothetical protein
MILYNKTVFKRCFSYRPRYWYKNIRYIPLYFKQLHYLIKHGHDVGATWDVYLWFQDTMQHVLTELRKNHHGTPCLEIEEGFFPESDEDWEKQDKLWNETLDEMIFLLNEMNEETCSKRNQYDDEWYKAFSEFSKKYGFFGEGLMSQEETDEHNKTGCRRIHMPDELPEYKEIMDNHRLREDELEMYRAECKDKFMDMFKKFYYNLWD